MARQLCVKKNPELATAQSDINNLKNKTAVGTPIRVYSGSASTSITTATTLWTATDDGLITACPVIFNGYGVFLDW